MPSTRRRFIRQAGLLAGSLLGVASLPSPRRDLLPPVRPPRLTPGDTVGIVSPAGITYDPEGLEIMEEIVEALGLRVKRGRHVLDRWGYLAGTDADRADDLNRMFADPEVDAVFALHGGWGAARILPLLDYTSIRAHPKILMGYSDITALLVALYARAGLVTFHGPLGNSTWNAYSVEHVRRLLFEAEPLLLSNPTDHGDTLVQVNNRVRTIRPGTARGRLVGGNLTVLTAIIGSAYLPDWEGHILFLEDINEDIYRIDRMLTQLRLAGVLERVAGVVFGKCTDCDPDSGFSSFTLHEVLTDHLGDLGVPAWHGAMIGHIQDKFTVPLGVEVEIDASAGTIQLLEPAVT